MTEQVESESGVKTPTTVDEWINMIYSLRMKEQLCEDRLKLLKQARHTAEINAALFFGEQGVCKAATQDGAVASIRRFLYVSKRKAVPDHVLVKWAKAVGWGELVKTREQIHPSTLRAHVNEVVTNERERRPGLEAKDCLPVEIQDLINLYEEHRVIVRGAGLKEREDSDAERNES